MSSRLLTMKFMQRAAAASADATDPNESDGPPNKRRRLSTNTDQDANQAGTSTINRDEKRQAVLDHQAAAASETKWAFAYKDRLKRSKSQPLRVINVGYSSIDSPTHETSRDTVSDPRSGGRKSWGKYNKAIEKLQNPDRDSSSSEAEGSADDDDTATVAQQPGQSPNTKNESREDVSTVRTERKARKTTHGHDERSQAAAMRRSKEVNLNNSGRISLGGGLSGSPSTTKSQTCHECGASGHLRRDCPQRRRETKQRRSMP